MMVSKRDRQAVIDKSDRQAVDNRQRTVRLAPRPLLSFLRRVQGQLGLGEAGVTICLVSEPEMARMNETFRKKKGPTDVLSFPSVARRRAVRLRLGSTHVKACGYLGDIAICPATARRYSAEHGRTLASELRVLILHGLLHLLGYDHETDDGEMGRIERKLRKRFGLA